MSLHLGRGLGLARRCLQDSSGALARKALALSCHRRLLGAYLGAPPFALNARLLLLPRALLAPLVQALPFGLYLRRERRTLALEGHLLHREPLRLCRESRLLGPLGVRELIHRILERRGERLQARALLCHELLRLGHTSLLVGQCCSPLLVIGRERLERSRVRAGLVQLQARQRVHRRAHLRGQARDLLRVRARAVERSELGRVRALERGDLVLVGAPERGHFECMRSLQAAQLLLERA